MNPVLALIIANIIWGMASPIFKFALTNIPPFTLAFIRFFFAGLIFLPLALNKWQKLTTRQWLEILLIGFFGITINISFFFLGVVKTESIFTLLSKEPVQLPKLTITVTPDDLANGKKCDMKIAITDLGDFKIQGDVRYNFNFHMGWDAGPEGNLPLKDNKLSFEVSNPIPENCWVLVPSAGVTVSYGKYYLRLHDQKMIFRGNWYEGIGRR